QKEPLVKTLFKSIGNISVCAASPSVCAVSPTSPPLRLGERRPSGTMEDKVVHIAKKMDKMAQKKNVAGALDLLKEPKNIPMTLELLQSMIIRVSVNAIHKQSIDEEVTSLAKPLIKSWKNY
ncbi:hypothetical protein STEG23_011046, partial [Scotinomys teguina]